MPSMNRSIPIGANAASLRVNTQYAVRGRDLPTRHQLQQWLGAVLPERTAGASILVRFTDAAESAELNTQYRSKNYPTNVLSFPAQPLPAGVRLRPSLGDLVLCVEVVRREAQIQGKPLEAHWAHLLLHGLLHLLGYDHETPAEASIMETLEQDLLTQLGYPNPYADEYEDE